MILKRANASHAPALEAGLDIVELLGREREAGFNELCRVLPMSKASVSRILKTLVARGYVRKDEVKDKWVAGAKLGLMGSPVPLADALKEESQPLLESYVDATGNTALCVYWNGSSFQVLSKVQREGAVAMMDLGSIVGDLSIYPWGWFFHLSLDAASRKAAIDAYSAKSLFKRRLSIWEAYYKKHGFAYDDHETMGHVRRIGVPVHDGSGKLVGALGSAGNRLCMPDDEVEHCGRELLKRAKALSTAIASRRLI